MKKRILKIIILLIEFLTITSSVLLLFLSKFLVDGHNTLFWFTFSIILPSVFILISSLLFVLTIKKKEILIGRKNYQKVLFIIYLIISLPWIVLSIFLGILYFKWNAPVFFPFHDQNATYIISKSGEYYYLTYELKSVTSPYTYMNCKFHIGIIKINCTEETLRNFTIPIGESPVDLKEFIGKEVFLNGYFSNSYRQCIIDNCVNMRIMPVFNILYIKLAAGNQSYP